MTGTKTNRITLVAAAVFLLANAGEARADYVTNAVSLSSWALSSESGGLGGGAVFLKFFGRQPI